MSVIYSPAAATGMMKARRHTLAIYVTADQPAAIINDAAEVEFPCIVAVAKHIVFA
jgi:hypothetical protein